MLHASQLRIGNLISLSAETELAEYRFVTAIQKEILQCSNAEETEVSVAYADVHGIYLTAEILEKCGFEKDLTNDDFYYLTIEDFRIGSSFVETWIEKGEGDFVEEIALEHCKHVHDLQNLVYALTRKELQINL